MSEEQSTYTATIDAATIDAYGLTSDLDARRLALISGVPRFPDAIAVDKAYREHIDALQVRLNKCERETIRAQSAVLQFIVNFSEIATTLKTFEPENALHMNRQ